MKLEADIVWQLAYGDIDTQYCLLHVGPTKTGIYIYIYVKIKDLTTDVARYVTNDDTIAHSAQLGLSIGRGSFKQLKCWM